MEILVVLVVISILVGLLFPALLSARERARQSRARAEVFEIQKAWQMYYQTYEKLPSHTEMSADATKVLGGDDIGGENPKKITFMEIDSKSLEEGFKDPWKKTYKLDLAKEAKVTTEWTFQSRVQCINAQRYKY